MRAQPCLGRGVPAASGEGFGLLIDGRDLPASDGRLPGP